MRLRRWLSIGVLGLATVAAGGGLYEFVLGIQERATAAPGRSIDVGGHRLHLWCMGVGSPVVVFESGGGGTSLDWFPVLSETSRVTTACSYDRAGLGFSETGPSPRTSARIADELSGLLERSQIPRPVVLVGWSVGGLHARMIATRHPADVAALVLVDASHEDQVAKVAAAGLSSELPYYAPLVPLAARLGLLRLAGERIVPSLDAWPSEVRHFVRATIHRPERYRALIDEETHFGVSAETR
jgi:pimeloyl-ACP methyl ester carboxylesterase